MKRVVLVVDFNLLAKLLQVPDGVEVEEVRCEVDEGSLSIRVRGMGHEGWPYATLYKMAPRVATDGGAVTLRWEA